MFKRILAATDGSANGNRAVETAADLAARYGAELVLVHVVQPGRVPDELRHMARVEHLVEPETRPHPHPGNVPSGHGYVLGGGEARDELRMATVIGERLLESAVETAGKHGVTSVAQVCETGDAAGLVIDTARERKADLIVTGTRGLGKLRGVLMGSVSHKVQQLAPCSVLVVR